MEKRKCLARELSDLIIYAVAVPFDHESRFKSWWIIYTGVHEGHYILGYVNERGFGVFFLLKLWPNELERKILNMFFKNDCAWSHYYYYVALVLWILIDQNNSFMDIGPLNYILVCCLTLMNNLIFFLNWLKIQENSCSMKPCNSLWIFSLAQLQTLIS